MVQALAFAKFPACSWELIFLLLWIDWHQPLMIRYDWLLLPFLQAGDIYLSALSLSPAQLLIIMFFFFFPPLPPAGMFLFKSHDSILNCQWFTRDKSAHAQHPLSFKKIIGIANRWQFDKLHLNFVWWNMLEVCVGTLLKYDGKFHRSFEVWHEMFFHSEYLSQLQLPWVMLVGPCEVGVFGLCIYCAFICWKCPDDLVSVDGGVLRALTPIYNCGFYGATCSHDQTQNIHALSASHTSTHTSLATSSSCCPHCVLILDKNANFLPLNEYTCRVFAERAIQRFEEEFYIVTFFMFLFMFRASRCFSRRIEYN